MPYFLQINKPPTFVGLYNRYKYGRVVHLDSGERRLKSEFRVARNCMKNIDLPGGVGVLENWSIDW
jgi:hypothetical protein